MHKNNAPIALIILDGWGYREDQTDNAIHTARTPNFDRLWAEYPHTLLDASGESVGLPEGQMGNSEIGHTTIGAGRQIYADLVRISNAIKTGDFAKNQIFLDMFAHVKNHNSTLHIQGLVSPGGIHSHIDHLVAFLRAAKANGVNQIAIHAFTDGRDTSPTGARDYLSTLENALAEIGIGFIATVSGRFYAMDRDQNWDRLARAEEAMFAPHAGITTTRKPSEILAEMYEKNIFDEHIEPVVFADSTGQTFPIRENDAVFFFNFRADRAKMISQKIIERTLDKNVFFATMTEYDKNLNTVVAYPPENVEATLAGEISAHNYSQAHIAETEKFAHATYFLNGGRTEPHKEEKHILIESRKDVKTHDEAPEMRAREITDKAIEEIERGTDFIFINYANPDMVGHTANVPAIIRAIETVDAELGRFIDALTAKGGTAYITADHGNAEVNIDPDTGERHTAHTLNPVPLIITQKNIILRPHGTLADIAPTILDQMEIPRPLSMTGADLTYLEK
jgi:2,3-bisphosphoglycerate-independent phosphoglycerate mutase